MDQFTYDSYKYEFDMLYVCPDDWIDIFESEKPDMFLCESAFKGLSTEKFPNGAWMNKILTNLNNDFENRQVLIDILNYCNDNNIPSVFYNKEDPPSFNNPIFNFVDIALSFDYIFTSSIECIPKYHEKGHNNVFPLMFAAQPRLFNPINTSKRLENTIIFAGSWYKKYPDRCNVMSLIFDKILQEGLNLKIYDRFSELGIEKMSYPDKYKEYTHPSVSYPEMPRVYKESMFGITINTVTNSSTMFARRIFELMVSNTIVFSNFSKGIYSLFGENVFYADTSDINLKNAEINRIREENLYNVLENHIYSNRFREILDGINFKYIPELKHIFLFYLFEDNLDDIYNHFNSIKYPYKHIKIISEENLNQDTISFAEFEKFNLDEENYFFSVVNLSMNPDFIKKALLHYSYIYVGYGIMQGESVEKYCFSMDSKIENVVFNSINFKSVKESFKDKKSTEFNMYNI